MKITQELVERIAQLARLALSEDEKERMGGQLEEILGRMAVLDKLTLEDDGEGQEQTNVFRQDEVAPAMERAALLKNAPQTDGEYIIVPDTLGQGE